MKSSVSARLNADILEEQYARWMEDPRSVEPTWAAFFEGFELGVAQPRDRGTTGTAAAPAPAAAGPAPSAGADIAFYGKVVSLIYNYRTLGHTQADINPLGPPERNPRLSPEQFGFSEADMDRETSNPLFRNGET